MTKNAPAPRTLYEACMRQEQARHAQRVKSFKGMQARLALLDAHVPAIRAAGLQLDLADIEDHYADKALRLSTGIFCSPSHQTLVEVLLEQGFKEVERHDYGSWYAVILGKGRLKVRISVTKPRQPGPPPQPTTPERA